MFYFMGHDVCVCTPYRNVSPGQALADAKAAAREAGAKKAREAAAREAEAEAKRAREAQARRAQVEATRAAEAKVKP